MLTLRRHQVILAALVHFIHFVNGNTAIITDTGEFMLKVKKMIFLTRKCFLQNQNVNLHQTDQLTVQTTCSLQYQKLIT